MTEIRLSFKDWPYPTKNPRTQCCALGECGFLATAVGSSVSIYSNEIGQFSPMFMWSPFDHNIIAMGWYDGSCTPSVVQPIIAIASSTGNIAIYDIRSRFALGRIKLKGETIKTIVWNPFYRSRFYVGTQSGRLVCLQIIENKDELSQESSETESTVVIRKNLKFNFSIDFISIDPQTGTTIAVASKKEGKFYVINNITTVEDKTEFEAFILPGKNITITSFSFFPGQVDYLIISTLQKAVLFSIIQRITIPLIAADDIRFISLLSNNGIIIGSSNSVALWKFKSKNKDIIDSTENEDNLEYLWKKVSQISFNTISSSIPENSLFAELENKVVIINHSNWITEIEERRNKLFITQRARLMPAKPLDWDFRKGSIAFCTSAGQVLVTSWTPDSIIQRAKTDTTPSNENNAQVIETSPIAASNENTDEKKKKRERYLMKEQKYRRQQMFGQNYNKKHFSTDSNDEDGQISAGNSSLDESSNTSLLGDSSINNHSSRPTFSMLMDQGDDEVEFEVDSDNFEKRDNLDFSSNFVSMQASHVMNKMKNNSRNSNRSSQKKMKLTNFGSTGSINEIPTSFLSLNNDEDLNINNNETNQIALNNNNNNNVDDSLKLPQEVSLDNDQQHNFFVHVSDSGSIGSLNFPNLHLEHDHKSSSTSMTDGSSENSTAFNNKVSSQIENPKCGNSLKLLLSFQVADYPLNHLMWAPGGRLIVWSFYNEKNILQMVDFKRRSVMPLLKVQLNAIHVPITNIFFSKDRSMFCVLIGNQTAVFMTTSAHPTQIGTLNFKHPVIGSFDPTGKKAVFVRKDGYIYYASINFEDKVIVVTTKCKSKYLHREKREEPTYVIWRTVGILVGTSIGNVTLLTNPNEDFEYKQIATIENSKILYISPVTKGSFLILNDKQCAYLTKEKELVCLQKKIKNIKSASKDSFLCRVAGNGRLTVLSSEGTYSPLTPPCVSRCPLMLDEDQYLQQLVNLKLKAPDEAIKACRLFGAIFIRRLIQSKINKTELQVQTRFLFQILSNCRDSLNVAFKLALMMGDRKTARNMLLKASPKSPNYVNNMTKAALFDIKEMGETMTQVIQNLYFNGKNNEASELLLIIGNIYFLVKKALQLGEPRDAAMYLRSRKVEEENLETHRKIAYDVSTELISNKHLLLGLTLLMENDFHDQVSKIVSGIFGDEMTHLLSFLKLTKNH